MERLWAPWRLEYVAAPNRPPETVATPIQLLPGADPDCFLCRAAAATADRENLVVDRDRRALSLLNRFPYNNGHLLITPYAHKADLTDLTEEEMLGLMRLTRDVRTALQKQMDPHGFNIGANLGEVAGAGLPGHVRLRERWRRHRQR